MQINSDSIRESDGNKKNVSQVIKSNFLVCQNIIKYHVAIHNFKFIAFKMF